MEQQADFPGPLCLPLWPCSSLPPGPRGPHSKEPHSSLRDRKVQDPFPTIGQLCQARWDACPLVRSSSPLGGLRGPPGTTASPSQFSRSHHTGLST